MEDDNIVGILIVVPVVVPGVGIVVERIGVVAGPNKGVLPPTRVSADANDAPIS